MTLLASRSGGLCSSLGGDIDAGTSIIDSTDETEVADDDVLVVTGRGFGAGPGDGKIFLADAGAIADIATWEEQTVDAWGSEEITITIVQGALDTGMAYLFVQHDNGHFSESLEITLAEGFVGIGDTGVVNSIQYIHPFQWCADQNQIEFTLKFTDKTDLLMYSTNEFGSICDAQLANEGSTYDPSPKGTCPMPASRYRYVIGAGNRFINYLYAVIGEPLTEDNATFANDIGDWVDISDGTSTVSHDGSDRMKFINDGDDAKAKLSVTVVSGEVYNIHAQVADATVVLRIGTTEGDNDILNKSLILGQSFFDTFTPNQTTIYLELRATSGSPFLEFLWLLKRSGNGGFAVGQTVTIEAPPSE